MNTTVAIPREWTKPELEALIDERLTEALEADKRVYWVNIEGPGWLVIEGPKGETIDDGIIDEFDETMKLGDVKRYGAFTVQKTLSLPIQDQQE